MGCSHQAVTRFLQGKVNQYVDKLLNNLETHND